MPVTTLDTKTALVLIDLQNGSWADIVPGLGFNVTLATDAMTDTNADAHTHSVTRIFPRLGETGSTQDIIALLPA